MRNRPAMRFDLKIVLAAVTLTASAHVLPAEPFPASPAGEEPAGEIARLEAEAEAFAGKGNFREAFPASQRAYARLLTQFGPDDVRTIHAQARVGLCHALLGEHAEAAYNLEAAAAAAEKALPPGHPTAVFALGARAMCYRLAGRAGDSAREFARLVPIWEKELGPDHAETLKAYAALGITSMELGRPEQAEEFTRKAIASLERVGGPPENLVVMLNNLGLILWQRGRLEEARQVQERALASAEEHGLAEHPLLGVLLQNNLGETHMSAGRPAEAERCYRRAVAIAERTGTTELPNALIAQNNLALLDYIQGRMAEAEEKLRRVVRLNEQVLGPNHPQTATSLTLLGAALSTRHDWVEATPLLKQAVTAFSRSPDPLAPAQHFALSALATAEANDHHWARAEQLLKNAYRVCRLGYGANSLAATEKLVQLATLYRQQHLPQQAKSLLEQVLASLKKSAPPPAPNAGPEMPLVELSTLEALADVEDDLGNFERSGELYARLMTATAAKFGADSPTLNSLRRSLAWNFLDRGQPAAALREARLVEQADAVRWAQILSFTAEEQRLRFQDGTSPFNLYGTLGAAGDLARSLLRRKGLVLDSVLDDRRVWAAATPGLRAKAARLAALRRPPAGGTSDAAATVRAGREAAELEAEIAREVAGLGGTRRALAVEPAQVSAALPAGSALVELVSYQHHLENHRREWRYGAVVLTASAPPVWVPLGEAKGVDQTIARYGKSVRGKTDEETLAEDLRALGRRLWTPLVAHLPAGTREVIFCPDDRLNLVSFATLLVGNVGEEGGGEGFLAERYAVRYVASGRDLLPRPAPAVVATTAPTGLCIFADPEFSPPPPAAGEPGEPLVAAAATTTRGGAAGRLGFGPLPGTAREAESLQRRAAGWGWPGPAVFTGSRATEANLRRVGPTRILHLATHGFVLSDDDPALAPPAAGSPGSKPPPPDNPMARAGLALAGAQTTLTAWREGRRPPGEDDGILTAEEVAGLPLGNTWLVVLSACETGAGEARSGEGVLGLRRGFVQAGAQNLLLTLWPVADQETAEWMVDFYTALAQPGADPAAALARTQRDWLVRLSREKGLLQAVNRAGAFILSSQGTMGPP